MKILAARTVIQTALKAIPGLAKLNPQLERDGDITSAIDADLGLNGLSLIVMDASGAVESQSRSGAAVSLNTVIGVAILENPNVNESKTGIGIPSSDVVELVIAAVMGLQSFRDGQITMAHEPWKRLPESEGMVVNIVGFHVPVVIRALT